MPLSAYEEKLKDPEDLRMHPNHLKLLKKAQALERMGDHPGAAETYRTFLAQAPRHTDAWSDYAGQLLALGQFKEAQTACTTALAIDPQNPSLRINLGAALLRQNLLEEAEAQFRAVVKSDPSRMDAQLFLAECLLEKRQIIAARRVLEGASRPGAMTGRYAILKPQLAQLWSRFAADMFILQRISVAEEACEEALRFDPSHLGARQSLGSIRLAQGRLEEGASIFKQLVASHPDEPELRLFLISALLRKGDTAEVENETALAIQEQPTSFGLHKMLTGLFYSFGRWAAFGTEVERYRLVDPTSSYLDFETSFVDLLFGRMPEGWEGYEARFRVPQDLRPQRSFEQPTWNGEPFSGKSLLVWSEQGLGDTLMVARYLPQVKALGGRVILEAQPSLIPVVATCAGCDEVLPSGEALPLHDLQVSLMSLPWVFRTNLASIPDNVPYLDVPAEVPNREALLQRLEAAGESTRIGVVWAGSPGHVRDIERSLPMEDLAPLADLQGVVWYSFQIGRPESPPLPNLISLGHLLGDFSDTAYALSGMDLLITVDTSIAHLAGAMGIPTLLLVSFIPDFRWLLERNDSPWYPSVRLYRQPDYGDWKSVVRKVVSDLTQEC